MIYLVLLVVFCLGFWYRHTSWVG